MINDHPLKKNLLLYSLLMCFYVYIFPIKLWRPVFNALDTDKDGKIHLDELRAFLHEGNSHLEELPPEVLAEIIERSDWDKNRYITFDEFLHMVQAKETIAIHPHIHNLVRYSSIAVVPKNQRFTTVRSYIDQYTCLPPPLFMIAISIIEIAVFVFYCVKLDEISTTGPVPYESDLIYNPRRRFEVWRYFTYALIHAGYLHLIFNIIVQLCLGVPLELIHKWWRVGLLYLAGVVAGSLGASISDPKSFLAGASGGVYALIATHLSNVVLNFSEMEYAWVRLLGLITFAFTDVGVAIYDRYHQMANHRVSYAAHIAGAVAGLLLGLIVLRNLRVRRWETLVGLIATAAFALLLLIAVLFNIFAVDFFEPSEK